MIHNDKVAIVAGGATGIGAAISLSLGREGAHVVVVSERPLDENTSVCAEIRAAGGSADLAVLDVRDTDAVHRLIADTVARRGHVDVVVNSAGVFRLTPVWERHESEIEQLFAVNSVGAITMINAALPALKAAGGGAIVSIASAGGLFGGETYAAYCASKAALIHYTRTLAPELKGTRIRVNCIAPGAVRTPMTASFHTASTPEQVEALERRDAASPSPYGAAFAEPEDIASVAMFLVSDAARAVHGACIVVDQGETAAMSLPPRMAES